MAYDPQYAHEYYMKHRQLKGRKKSVKKEDGPKKESMNGRGLSKAQKAELKEYWNTLEEELAEEKESITESKNTAIEQMNKRVNAELQSMKNQLEGASKEKKAEIREKMKALREARTNTRKSIVALAKSEYSSAKKKTYDSYNSKLNSMSKR